jgi:MYXO-CTERM domain-containing protein
MKKSLLVASILASVTASGAMADMLYTQSFENTDWLGGKYFDTGDAAVDHWLTNNAGEATVNGDGFNAWYGNTRDGVGLTDGDYVGVTNYGSQGFYDGDQGYQMSDTDGMMSLFFDDYGSDVNFSVAIYIASTGYESDDSLSIMYGGTTIASFGELELEGSAGTWMLIEGSGVSGQLSINFDSNSGTEAVFIDAVNIWTGAIPAPGALALLGLAGLASRRRRK